MGFAADNLQVRAPGGDAHAHHGSLLDVLRGALCEVPWAYREVGERDTPQRAVAVAPAGDGPWLVVFDREATRPGRAQLCATITARLRTAAVSVGAYDTDVELELYRDGHPADRVDVVVAGRAPRRGDVARWRDLVTDPGRLDALRAAWEPTGVPREGAVLAAMATLLGWDPLLARDTFESYTARRVRGGAVLYLRREGPEPPALVSCRDPEHPPVRVPVGKPAMLELTVASTGGDGLGIGVTVSGADVASGAVVVRSAALRECACSADFAPRETPGGTVWRAEFPSAELVGQGHVVSADSARAQQAMLDALLTVEVECVLEGPGAATLRVAIEPLESPDLGRIEENVMLVG